MLISGLDIAGSTIGQWAALAEQLRARDWMQVVATWDACPDPSVFCNADQLLVIGASYGGHEAVKFCRRANRPIDGLVILDGVWQENQFFNPPFEIPGNVRWALSIRRRCFWPPFSKGFDQTGFNRILQIRHEDFPRHPAVISQVVNWVGANL